MESDHFTMTECYGMGEPDYLVYIGAVIAVVYLVAICLALWRIFTIVRGGPVKITVLGLNENPGAYSKFSSHGISWQTLLYGLTGLTFAFEVCRYVMDLLSTVYFY
jgi:hypothetical protein